MKYGANAALSQYKQVTNHGDLADANPHKLIEMLMQGLLDRCAEAKGAIERDDIELKGTLLTKAIGIVGGLREALDLEKGGDLATNLDRLYDYMQRRLIEANLKNNPAFVTEVADLMREIKTGWDEIPAELRTQPSSE